MKKTAFAFLVLTAFLSGCGKQSVPVENIQSQFSAVSQAHMEAEIFLHAEEEDNCFTVTCSYTPDKAVITVEKPEELYGLTATVDGEKLTVSYENMILPATTPDTVCPANILPYLFRVLSEGYVTEYSEEQTDGVTCYRLTLEDENMCCTVWTDKESLIPRFAEIAGEDGAVVLSVKMLTFNCTLTEE